MTIAQFATLPTSISDPRSDLSIYNITKRITSSTRLRNITIIESHAASETSVYQADSSVVAFPTPSSTLVKSSAVSCNSSVVSPVRSVLASATVEEDPSALMLQVCTPAQTEQSSVQVESSFVSTTISSISDYLVDSSIKVITAIETPSPLLTTLSNKNIVF